MLGGELERAGEARARLLRIVRGELRPAQARHVERVLLVGLGQVLVDLDAPRGVLLAQEQRVDERHEPAVVARHLGARDGVLERLVDLALRQRHAREPVVAVEAAEGIAVEPLAEAPARGGEVVALERDPAEPHHRIVGLGLPRHEQPCLAGEQRLGLLEVAAVQGHPAARVRHLVALPELDPVVRLLQVRLGLRVLHELDVHPSEAQQGVGALRVEALQLRERLARGGVVAQAELGPTEGRQRVFVILLLGEDLVRGLPRSHEVLLAQRGDRIVTAAEEAGGRHGRRAGEGDQRKERERAGVVSNRGPRASNHALPPGAAWMGGLRKGLGAPAVPARMIDRIRLQRVGLQRRMREGLASRRSSSLTDGSDSSRPLSCQRARGNFPEGRRDV